MPNYPYKTLGTGTTRDFRNDLNENFSEISDDMQEHKDRADNIQAQVDNLVADGDSSPEAAQARVGADGTNYTTLKQRLDAENQSVTAQLADMETRKADQSFVDSQFAAIVSGAPKATYTNLAAIQNAYPNGTDGVMLALDNGHWYYWNSTTLAWTDGGTYQTTGIADGSITTVKRTTLGEFGWVTSDLPININTSNKTLEFPNTDNIYVTYRNKNISIASTMKNATMDISLAGFLYIDTSTNTIKANNDLPKDKEDYVILGYIFFSKNTFKLNMNFTVDGRTSMADNSVSTSKIADGAVTFAKRSKLGSLVFLTTGSPVNFDTVNGVMTWGATVWVNFGNNVKGVPAGTLNFGTNPVIAYDPVNNVFKSYSGSSAVQDSEMVIAVMQSGKVVTLINYYTVNGLSPYGISGINNLFGKTMNLLGDSMVHGHTLGFNKTWGYKIGQRNNMTVRDYGINGTCIAGSGNTNGDSMVDRYSSMDNAADFVGVFGGTNDAGSAQIPIGSDGDNTIDTFKGALNILCDGLQTKYPSSKIFFITPYPRNNISAYVDAILSRCEAFCIPVFNNYKNGGINWNNMTQTASLTMGDGTHLNEAGHQFASTKYESFINSL